jgi:Tfp pilus assembly protein PilN
VNAVNLLPQKHRPRQATGGKQGSSFVLLGVLGAIVVAVLVYVLSANSINSAKTDIAQAKADTVRANAQADALGAYGNFEKVKADRVKSVQDLATSRIDWERTLREVAHVLPSGVWITNADASDTPTTDGGTGAVPAAPAGGTGASAAQPAATGPTVALKGCAPSQDAVAETLVRLRQLQGATDVTLDHSTKPDAATASGGSSSSAGSASATDCGTTNGATNYEFQVNVSLESPKPSPDASGQVPASLGGGQ